MVVVRCISVIAFVCSLIITLRVSQYMYIPGSEKAILLAIYVNVHGNCANPHTEWAACMMKYIKARQIDPNVSN